MKPILSAGIARNLSAGWIVALGCVVGTTHTGGVAQSLAIFTIGVVILPTLLLTSSLVTAPVEIRA